MKSGTWQETGLLIIIIIRKEAYLLLFMPQQNYLCFLTSLKNINRRGNFLKEELMMYLKQEILLIIINHFLKLLYPELNTQLRHFKKSLNLILKMICKK